MPDILETLGRVQDYPMLILGGIAVCFAAWGLNKVFDRISDYRATKKPKRESPAPDASGGGKFSERAEEKFYSKSGDESKRENKERAYAQVLGLRGELTRGDIRDRYLALAAKYHPDKVNHLGAKIQETADSEMKRINEAYAYFKTKYGC